MASLENKEHKKKRELLVDNYGRFLLVKSWCYQSHQKICASDSTNKFQIVIEWLNILTYEISKLWQMETVLCFYVLFQFS
jgi:hypothetical protein